LAARNQASRCTAKPAQLWFVGLNSNALMLRCGGNVATHQFVSALSSAGRKKGNRPLLLDGSCCEVGAADAYEKASKLKPCDAMESLDIRFARSQIE